MSTMLSIYGGCMGCYSCLCFLGGGVVFLLPPMPMRWTVACECLQIFAHEHEPPLVGGKKCKNPRNTSKNCTPCTHRRWLTRWTRWGPTVPPCSSECAHGRLRWYVHMQLVHLQQPAKGPHTTGPSSPREKTMSSSRARAPNFFRMLSAWAPGRRHIRLGVKDLNHPLHGELRLLQGPHCPEHQAEGCVPHPADHEAWDAPVVVHDVMEVHDFHHTR